jgi:hypothetical protein
MPNQRTKLGPICSDSAHPRDVIPTLLRELRDVGGSNSVAYALRDSDLGRYIHHETMEWLGDWEAYADSEDAGFDLRDIIFALNEYALPHTFYGANPDDGACYGLWAEPESAAADPDTLKVADWSEVPADYVGLVFYVNDRGNASLYWADPDDIRTNGLCEIWSIV